MPGPRTTPGSYSHHCLELLCKPKEFVERELHLRAPLEVARSVDISGSARQGQGWQPKKDAKPTTKPNVLIHKEGPEASEAPEAPGGPRRPPGAENSRLRSAPRPSDQSLADKEWEFRALARNPKRFKVGWMPA